MDLSLCSCILTCSKLFYGLTSAAVRRLAYQYALKNKISMPASWTQNEMAGYDWLHSFLKRNTNISYAHQNLQALQECPVFIALL